MVFLKYFTTLTQVQYTRLKFNTIPRISKEQRYSFNTEQKYFKSILPKSIIGPIESSQVFKRWPHKHDCS